MFANVISRPQLITRYGILATFGIIFSPVTHAGSVALAWDVSTGATGYRLYYGQASASYTANVDVGNQTTHTLTSLQDGKTYYFAVKAYNGTATSGYSNEVSKTISSTTPTAPTANFNANPTSGTAPLTVNFTDASTGSITSRSWNFGDCNTNPSNCTSTATSGTKTYSTLGTYTMSLTVTGPGGSSTATKTITATATAPIANFTASPTSGTAPLAVNFTNSSTGSVTTYTWNFGDGSTSTSTNPAHTYSTAGTYTVSLTADGPGGTDTTTQASYITASTGGGSTGGGTNGLVAAYNFEEVSGSKVIDASGQGNHGTLSGASRISPGKSGQALSFDGVNDWVTVNDASSLDLTSAMTLMAWVFPTTSSGTRDILLKEGASVDIYNLYARNWRGLPESNVFAGGINRTSEGAALSPNVWTHLAGTFDGSRLRLFVNGTEVPSTPVSGPITTSGGPLRIGGNSIWGEFFQGHIDEVRIYNRALSATEIATNMNTSVATSSPPIFLAGYQTKGAIEDSNPQGRAQAFQTQASVTGWVTSLSVYVDTNSTATKLVAGIYADNNGYPGDRLAQGTLKSPGSGGWQQLGIPPVSLNAGVKYWIAILSPDGTLIFRDEGGFVGGPSVTSKVTSLPSTWPTGATYVYEGPVSAYGAGYR